MNFKEEEPCLEKKPFLIVIDFFSFFNESSNINEENKNMSEND